MFLVYGECVRTNLKESYKTLSRSSGGTTHDKRQNFGDINRSTVHIWAMYLLDISVWYTVICRTADFSRWIFVAQWPDASRRS
jgi:hypothetical protein